MASEHAARETIRDHRRAERGVHLAELATSGGEDARDPVRA